MHRTEPVLDIGSESIIKDVKTIIKIKKTSEGKRYYWEVVYIFKKSRPSKERMITGYLTDWSAQCEQVTQLQAQIQHMSYCTWLYSITMA